MKEFKCSKPLVFTLMVVFAVATMVIMMANAPVLASAAGGQSSALAPTPSSQTPSGQTPRPTPKPAPTPAPAPTPTPTPAKPSAPAPAPAPQVIVPAADGSIIALPAGTVTGNSASQITIPAGTKGSLITHPNGQIEYVPAGFTIDLDSNGVPIGHSFNNPFTDVRKGTFNYDRVGYAYANGLMVGTNSTRFNPNTAINRATLLNALYLRMGAPDVTAMPSTFTDVAAQQFYANAAKWAALNNLTAANGKFNANSNITKQEAAILIYSCVKMSGIKLPELRPYTAFRDSRRIAAPAQEAIEVLYRAGIIDGRNFNPTKSATRGEIVDMLYRLSVSEYNVK